MSGVSARSAAAGRPSRGGPGAAVEADVVIVGAGAAGLSLAWRLAGRAWPDARPPTVALVEPPPGPTRSPDRTWCFWAEPASEWAELATASWRRLRVRGPDGDVVTANTPRPYTMLRSPEFTSTLRGRLAGARRLTFLAGTVTAVTERPGEGPRVAGVDPGGAPFGARAGWVFDSRPPRRPPPARALLWQRFRGYFVRAEADRFDPSVAELMDLRVPQPPVGVAFVYLLPLTPREALIEHTVFCPASVPPPDFDAALRHYTSAVRPLGAYTVTGVEQGAIPMSDGIYPRRRSAHVIPIGAAAGAIRPATGYAFAAISRQTAAVDAALRAGRDPAPPPPLGRRHRVMDAVLLRALAAGRVDGARFFADLFARNSVTRVLDFLDGRSTLGQDLALGLRVPVPPMLRCAAELPFARRSRPEPADAQSGDDRC